jgi:hypothetical protein
MPLDQEDKSLLEAIREWIAQLPRAGDSVEEKRRADLIAKIDRALAKQ